MTKNKYYEKFDDNGNVIWKPNRKSEISKKYYEISKKSIIDYENSLYKKNIITRIINKIKKVLKFF
jgi:hypothetical protein